MKIALYETEFHSFEVYPFQTMFSKSSEDFSSLDSFMEGLVDFDLFDFDEMDDQRAMREAGEDTTKRRIFYNSN